MRDFLSEIDRRVKTEANGFYLLKDRYLKTLFVRLFERFVAKVKKHLKDMYFYTTGILSVLVLVLVFRIIYAPNNICAF